MSLRYGILHLTGLAELTAEHVNRIGTMVNLANQQGIKPIAVVATGISGLTLRYTRCVLQLNQLLSTLNLTRSDLIVLPGVEDKQHLATYADSFHNKVLQTPFASDLVQFVQVYGLQMVGVLGDGAEEHHFQKWNRPIPKESVLKPARILITTQPVSHWHTVPRSGFTRWRVNGPLYELTTAETKAPQPFNAQIATPPGVCKYLAYHTTDQMFTVKFKFVFNEEARPVALSIETSQPDFRRGIKR